MNTIKAIVLSCDEYSKYTVHMLQTYYHFWPNNPFIFYIPWNIKYPKQLENNYNVKLIRTEKPIYLTVLKLIENIPDNEWIYWCIDDKYLVNIDYKLVEDIFFNNLIVKSFNGISFTKKQKNASGKKSVILNDKKFFIRNSWNTIWKHQFLRCGVIRYFFNNIKPVTVAKNMDKEKHNVKFNFDNMWLSEIGIMKLNESTRSGIITDNCKKSMGYFKWNQKI